MLKYKVGPENLTLREAKERDEAWKDFIKRKNAIQKHFQEELNKI